MIEPILGSENAERTLIYILMRDKGMLPKSPHFTMWISIPFKTNCGNSKMGESW